MKRTSLIFVGIIVSIFVTGCVTNSVRSFKNSTWDVNLDVSGCSVNAVNVTNNGGIIESFFYDIYIKNKNISNQTFGYLMIFDCSKIAPGETRSCRVNTWNAEKASYANLGGLGCPDMDFELR